MSTTVHPDANADQPQWPRIGEPQFGRIQDVCKLVGFGKSHVFALVREGKFPQPIREGGRLTLFRLDEVRGYIEPKTEAARSAEAES